MGSTKRRARQFVGIIELAMLGALGWMVPSVAAAQDGGRAAVSTQATSPRQGGQGVETSPDARIDALNARIDELEMSLLQLEAAQAVAAPEESSGLKLKAFSGGQRALQALNPELSVVGDVFARYIVAPGGAEYLDDERSGFFVRTIGLHFQSNLDPFAFTKIAIEVGPEGAELGEGYATWTSVLPRVSVTAGKFRQELGVVNRWHKHGLDQFDFPLMLTVPFGEEGLNQTGVSLHAELPHLWADSLGLTVQVTNGQNDNVFAGDFFSVPAELVRLNNYWDLNRDTYLQVGLTGMYGFNNRRGYLDEQDVVQDEPWRSTLVAGADLTLNWEPVNRAKYRHITWRTEGLFIQKEVEGGTIGWVGWYTSLEGKVARSWAVGGRLDMVQDFSLTNNPADLSRWEHQMVPYVTWWQSPWVRFRLEYVYHQPLDGDPDHRVMLQSTFAAGPHKHDRY